MRTLEEVAQRVNSIIQKDFEEGKVYKGVQSAEFVGKELFGERKQYLKRAIENCREAKLLFDYEDIEIKTILGRNLAINSQGFVSLEDFEGNIDWDTVEAVKIFKISKKKLDEPIKVGKGKKTISMRLDKIQVCEGLEDATINDLVEIMAKRKYSKYQSNADEFEKLYCNTGLLTIDSATYAYKFLETLCGDFTWNVINERIKKGSDFEKKKFDFYSQQIKQVLIKHIEDENKIAEITRKIFDILSKKYK